MVNELRGKDHALIPPYSGNHEALKITRRLADLVPDLALDLVPDLAPGLAPGLVRGLVPGREGL